MAAFPGVSLVYQEKYQWLTGGSSISQYGGYRQQGGPDCVLPLSIQVEKPPCGAFLVTGWLGEIYGIR